MKKFMEELIKLGIECKLVKDSEYSAGFPSKNPNEWFSGNKGFKKLVHEFKPDAIFVDKQSHFGAAAIDAKIPLFVLLRGHYWSELEYAKKTIYKSKKMQFVLGLRDKIAQKCFREATVILPICVYLEDVVKTRYPKQNTNVFFEGIDASIWYPTAGMKLKHPCVGLLQGMNVWGKTRELLTLTKVMKELPEVTFYFVGDGFYRDKIIPKLKNFKNFVWLGSLEYPVEVKKFLSEIDVYLLLSGMEGLGQTIIEALLMEKPVIATNIGGIPELIEDGKTGFLIETGNHEDLIKKINQVFDQPAVASNMGSKGKEIIQKKFNWDNIAKKFVLILNQNL